MCGCGGVEELQKVGKDGLQHLLEELIVPNPVHAFHAPLGSWISVVQECSLVGMRTSTIEVSLDCLRADHHAPRPAWRCSLPRSPVHGDSGILQQLGTE